MRRLHLGVALGGFVLATAPANAAGDPEAGARAFRPCAACHSLEPGRHMTGPRLAGIWGHESGSAEGFRRSSPALRSASIIWDETTLDAWLTEPRAFLPGNWMTFQGIKEPKTRADVIAFLQAA